MEKKKKIKQFLAENPIIFSKESITSPVGEKKKGEDSQGYSQGEKVSYYLKLCRSKLGHFGAERQKIEEWGRGTGNKALNEKMIWKLKSRHLTGEHLLSSHQSHLVDDRNFVQGSTSRRR